MAQPIKRDQASPYPGGQFICLVESPENPTSRSVAVKMLHRASDLPEALRIAEQLQACGACDWFRGQTRPWPLLSSFGRLDAERRNAAKKRLARFSAWVRETPGLARVADDEDAVLAVAQHYGIPTNFIDFTTEPAVAAFFAVHDPPARSGPDDKGSIICLNTGELADVWESVRRLRPEWPPFERITVNIPELWRIQAQHGVFLPFPFDEGFERNIFGFDRILFPAADDPAATVRLIPVDDIYPSQKSDLEILLDQYFMLERLAEGTRRLLDLIQDDAVVQTLPDMPGGWEADCFRRDGLPLHPTWDESALAAWSAPLAERWTPISRSPMLHADWPSLGLSPIRRRGELAASLLEQIRQAPDCRSGPVRFRHAGLDESNIADISKAMSLLWDGLRRWPFSDIDIANGLATTAEFARMVAASPGGRTDVNLADELAAKCFGVQDAIEVEVTMTDGSYTRGYAVPKDLEAAMRPDFGLFLTDAWRPRINSIWSVLQVAWTPQRIFRFDALASIFARQIAPTQVVLRGTDSGKARLYNPARAVRIRLP